MKVWYYTDELPQGEQHDLNVRHVTEWRADTDREPCGNRPSGSGSWTSTERLTDEQLTEWTLRRYGFDQWGQPLGGDCPPWGRGRPPWRVKIHRAPVQGPLDTLYLVEDYSSTDDGEEHRWMGIKRANWGGRHSMIGDVVLRSQEFHSIPEGDADEISQILKAAEGGYDERFKRIAVAHEGGDMVVVWSPRNAHDDEESDWLRMPRSRLIELLRGWLRPEEITS